jgi:hypothetical protein
MRTKSILFTVALGAAPFLALAGCEKSGSSHDRANIEVNAPGTHVQVTVPKGHEKDTKVKVSHD